MAPYIIEPEKRLPVAGTYDVVIVGGGIAGVAAALSAVRNGVSVCLVEKENALGGLATLGNVAVYLPLCDGMGNRVIGGIGEELLKLSIRDGFEEIPACWRDGGDPEARLKDRYRVTFNPASFLLELEDLVVRSGVTLCYDTRFCDVAVTEGRVDAVIVENKEGRSALRCRTVVDASGDADVCARAGEEMESLNSNVRTGWFYFYDGSDVELVKLSRPFDKSAQRMPEDAHQYAGDRAVDVTAQTVDTRKLVRERLAELSRERGRPVRPVSLATLPSFRMTRRLRGRVELTEADDRRYFEDAVGMVGDWRMRGPVYYIPLRCLTGVKTENLIVAGRCISAGGRAWDVARAIPVCAVTGEAAGTAAALACRGAEGRFSKLDVTSLQDRLRAQNVPIDRRFASGGKL